MRPTPRRRGPVAIPGSLLAAAALALAAAVPAQAAQSPPAAAPAKTAAGPVLRETLHLPDGRTANVFAGGIVQLFSKDRGQVEYRTYPSAQGVDGFGLPDAAHLTADLMREPAQPYARGDVVVVFQPGVSGVRDVAGAAVSRSGAPAPLTNDAATNALLGRLGVDRSERLFRTQPQQALAAIHGSLQGSLGRPVLDFSNAYRLHLTGASVPQAVTALLKAPASRTPRRTGR